jgi:hypothetical protein
VVLVFMIGNPALLRASKEQALNYSACRQSIFSTRVVAILLAQKIILHVVRRTK